VWPQINEVKGNPMDSDHKVMAIVATCAAITIMTIAVSGFVTTYFYDKLCIEHGYTREALPGNAGTQWVLPANKGKE
jgi:hypothetical protein